MLGLFFITAISIFGLGEIHQDYLAEDLGNDSFIEYLADIAEPDYSVLDEKK